MTEPGNRTSRASMAVGVVVLAILAAVIAGVAVQSLDRPSRTASFDFYRGCENQRAIRTKFEPGVTAKARLETVEAALQRAGGALLPSLDLPKQRVVVTRMCEATAAAGAENDFARSLRRVDHVEKVEVLFVHVIEN